MKVLVLGASGFIGLPTALAFSRAGHIVYGTTRDAKSARKLEIHEILPVITPPSAGHGSAHWSKIAQDCDVIVDTIRTSDGDAPEGALRAAEALSSSTPGTRKTYIYIGTLADLQAKGAGIEGWVSETSQPTGQEAWRAALETQVLSSNAVNGIVIRAGILYGRSGSTLEPYLFAPAYDASKNGGLFDTVGYPETRVLMVHQDDLAELVVRAAERAPALKGVALAAANPQSERWTDVLDAVKRVSGAQDYRLRAPGEISVESAWASTTQLRPTLAHALTGWTPRKLGLVDGMDAYWAAFKAHYVGKKMIPAWDLPGVMAPGRSPSLSA